MANVFLDILPIDTYSVTTIAFADTSDYGTTLVSNPSFEVTPPGWNKVNLFFTPSNVNVYNASHFNIACDNQTALPDGPWTVKYSIYPNAQNFVEKTFFRTELIRCKYSQAFLKMETTCECNGQQHSKLKQQLQNIKLLIEGAVASSNQCDNLAAMDKYKQADRLLGKLNFCECNQNLVHGRFV